MTRGPAGGAGDGRADGRGRGGVPGRADRRRSGAGRVLPSARSGATGRSCRCWSAMACRSARSDDGQRRLAHELIVAGTSMLGYSKVVSVMAMEHVLRALAPWTLADLFDPERYCFKVFGSPGDAGRGAGSLPGITCRLNFTVVEDRLGLAHPVHARRRRPRSCGTARAAAGRRRGTRPPGWRELARRRPARRAAIIDRRPPPDLAAPRNGAAPGRDGQRPGPGVGAGAGLCDRRGRARTSSATSVPAPRASRLPG